MDFWIVAAICAAFVQTIRFMLQKVLSAERLSVAGSTFARFVYSFPFVWLLVVSYWLYAPEDVPLVGAAFWGWAVLGGSMQIFATLCVVSLFRTRNFAVGMTFKKTETLLAALVGFLVLGEGLGWIGGAALMVGAGGMILISAPPSRSISAIINRASGLGILSGLFFAICAVAYRAASLQIDSDNPLMRAAITLVIVLSWQTLAMAVWLFLIDRPQIKAVWRAGPTAIWVGLTSLLGSYLWFTAFTLQNVAYVNAVGQIELVFSMLASTVFFKETMSRRESVGIVLILCSVIVIILAPL